MRADRDDLRFANERRPGNYTLLIAAGAVLILAILLYIGLSDSDEVPAAAAPMPVVRDSAVVEPPVVDTTAPQPQAVPPQPTASRRDFNERQLAPPTSTVGAGTAPISESANAESLVIDGDLLEELESDAQSRDGAQQQ